MIIPIIIAVVVLVVIAVIGLIVYKKRTGERQSQTPYLVFSSLISDFDLMFLPRYYKS